MARKPTSFGVRVEAEIKARAARGESGTTIAHALGLQKQARTIERRVARLRGRASVAKVDAPTEAPAVGSPRERRKREKLEPADVPDEVPEGTPIEDIDEWIKRLEAAATTAESQGNLQALASLAAKVGTMMALKQRSQPLPKADPNENPDMIALAEQGEKRLQALVHDLFAAQ